MACLYVGESESWIYGLVKAWKCWHHVPRLYSSQYWWILKHSNALDIILFLIFYLFNLSFINNLIIINHTDFHTVEFALLVGKLSSIFSPTSYLKIWVWPLKDRFGQSDTNLVRAHYLYPKKQAWFSLPARVNCKITARFKNSKHIW